MLERRTLCLLAIAALLVSPVLSQGGLAQSLPRADGKTPVLTPEGTWIVPPPGAPLQIVREDARNVTRVENGTPWGGAFLKSAHASPTPTASGVESSCSDYLVGWYETSASSVYGGHMGIHPQNMPPNPLWYCLNTGMGYTDAVSFGASSWIQAGLATFPGEVGAKWFCQSNNEGTTNTLYGPANAYGNGATVYSWFARDSSGVWRTYRYDTGPYSVELGCTITRGAGGNVQHYGEIQGATSTSAPMGPWTMFDLRYEATNGNWYAPSQLHTENGAPCPPYGAGSVSGGSFAPGSGASCTTGTSPYPN